MNKQISWWIAVGIFSGVVGWWVGFCEAEEKSPPVSSEGAGKRQSGGSGFSSAEPLPAAVGTIVFQTDFSAKEALEGWSGATEPAVRWVKGESGGGCLMVEVPGSEKPRSCYLRRRLPLEAIRGTRIGVRCQIRAEQVAAPPQPWNGIKCMVQTVSPTGPRWHHPQELWGSFDWQPVAFLAEIPPEATEVWLILGLEQTHGRVWFDDLKVQVVRHRRRSPPAKAEPVPPAPSQAGPPGIPPALPKGMILRGAMISPQVTEADLRVLSGQWKANHVRWQLLWGGFPHGPADKADLPQYEAWLESALHHLDRLLPVCRELGIKVCVDLHTPPGGRDKTKIYRMFQEKRFQEAFVGLWEKMAHRYREEPAVWGYDLVNEPVETFPPEGLRDWQALAELAARRIRAIDPHHAIIIEPSPWGAPEGLDWLEPVDVPGIVYSVHMYIPHRFTHQGIHGQPSGVAYPGWIAGKYWDPQALREALEPVIRYQNDYHVPIYIGEFSAIRWAPGKSAYYYLRDVIEIFEEHGWHWAYHAFREWDGWSVEHGPDPKDHTPTAQPTDRQLLLRSWFEKNRPAVTPK